MVVFCVSVWTTLKGREEFKIDWERGERFSLSYNYCEIKQNVGNHTVTRLFPYHAVEKVEFLETLDKSEDNLG